jgi:predicted ATPase/DNA-binding SARP family transcriptional activator
MTQTPSLKIRLLGPFEVVAGRGPLDVSGSKRHRLLALLALRRGRVLGVDELIDALWGEALPAAPRNALQHHVARLRAVLGQETIAASDDGYALTDATVDALRFEELLGEARVALREGDPAAAADSIAQALGLWRGPALHGLANTTWFSGEARRLEALRVDALEEQFEAALALGEHREIVSGLRAAVEENPFRERLWGQLMLALYRSGRQADALESFQGARRVLGKELGLEPGPELRRLQEAILAHDPLIAPVLDAPRRGNLPRAPTSFVDREEELAQVIELLREHRLVTLTGPPGVGKSRLALEVGRALEGEIADGIWRVDLARAAGAADVAGLVARTVGARGADPLERVIARLRASDAMLLLDGCRSVVDEAARIASTVLSECPDVRVLATSRELLHVPGGARVHLEPLAVPDRAATESDEWPALQLFLARAHAARPGFDLTPEAAPLAAEITRRVDGLPLAIELVAARVSVLGLAELLSIVERRLALRHDRPASDPARTALQDLVEWSYDLLHSDEQTLLHQLAVHRGGASFESLLTAAERHGLDEPTATYLLGALVDKSIVSVSFPDGEARYDLLDTVRDYVIEQLAESGVLAAAQKAHADYFATLADAARTGLRSPEWLSWMKRLEREHDNFWAALAYARDTPDPLVRARLGAGLGWYFGTAERVSEGRAFIEAALAAADDVPLPLRVELLAYLCYLATEEEDLEAAVEAGEQGVALASSSEVPWETAMVQLAYAFASARAGPHERAVALAEEARRGFEKLGDRWGEGSSALTGALGAIGLGDIPTAAALTAEAVRLHEDYDVGAIPATLLEAWLAERQEDAKAAAAAYRRALERSERAGFAEHASFALTALGAIAFADGDLSGAEAEYRRAWALADSASASWLVAQAKAKLAQVLAAGGDAEGAERLYRGVIAWSEEPRRHTAREALFIALAGSPLTAALLGLAELAEAGGDAAAAEELRARAGLAHA